MTGGEATERVDRGRRIVTPDQRLRVFVSTLQELAGERAAASKSIAALRLTPVLSSSEHGRIRRARVGCEY